MRTEATRRHACGYIAPNSDHHRVGSGPTAAPRAGAAGASRSRVQLGRELGGRLPYRLLVGRSTVVDVGIADRARVADQRRRRRRAGDVVEPAARERQGAGHDLDVRLGPRRRAPPLRGAGAARSRASRRTGRSSFSRARRSTSSSNGRRHRPVGHGVEQGHGRDGRSTSAAGTSRSARRSSALLRCAGEPREQPGAAARPLRRGEPQRADRAGASFFTGPTASRTLWARDDEQFPAPVPATSKWTRRSSTSERRTTPRGKFTFSDFLNLFLFSENMTLGCWSRRCRTPRAVPEPGRAEPGRRERQGGELPRRRRVPDADRPGLWRNIGVSTIQFKEFGVRLTFTPTVIGESRAPQGPSGGQHARLHQRDRAAGLPHSGARRAAPRPSSSCATARRSRSPVC